MGCEYQMKCISYFSLFFPMLTNAYADNSTFVKFQYDELISIESPRHWIYQNEQIRRHLNTGSEAALRLLGIPLGQGDNKILLAATTYTSYKSSSATVRLSVRQGATLTQGNIQEMSAYSKADLDIALSPANSETERMLRSLEGVRYAKAVESRIDSNGFLNCIFAEFEYGKSDGVTLSQTWICPLGDKSIKLSTSYRKSESYIFKPVISYIWKSLQPIEH